MARFPSIHAPRAIDLLPPPARFAPIPDGPLLPAVISNKDADAPRMAYAQWCLTTGHTERGRFILEQLAGLAAKPDPKWEQAFEPWSARDLIWRRGFVEELSLAGRAFIAGGATLMQSTPLRSVRLVAITPFLKELAACEHLLQLESLDLRGNGLTLNDIEPFPSFRRLQVHIGLFKRFQAAA